MTKLLVVTPVKNALANTLETCKAIASSSIEVAHIVYNDFSDASTKAGLEKAKQAYGFELVHLEELTTHPSPNYKLVLQLAQKRALQTNLPFVVVESDVTVGSTTLENLLDHCAKEEGLGLIGAVTTDSSGLVNYPYEKFKSFKGAYCDTKRSLSFCCTLMTPSFLSAFSFEELNNTKDWYDTFISKKALERNFANRIVFDTPVIHKPHSSRPWKLLKYSNPLKYYIEKLLKRRDKI